MKPPIPWTATARLIAPLLAWRATLLFTMLASVLLLPDLFDEVKWAENPHWPADLDAPDFATHFKTWDSQHYLRIAEVGYAGGTKTSAFYPLWPLAIRAASPLFGGSVHIAAMVLANLFALLASLLLFRVAQGRFGERAALRFLMLFLAFPGAFFLGLPYSESLFLLLIAGFFWSLDEQSWPGLAATCFMLPICRPTGVLILAPLAIFFFLRWRDGQRSTGRDLSCLAAPLLGFLAYLLTMKVMSGAALEGFAAQSLFHTQSSIARLFDPIGFVSFFWKGAISLHGVTTSLIDRTWILWLLGGLYPLWRYDKVWFVFALVMGLVPAVTAPVVSFTRYALVLFPLFALTAFHLDKDERRFWTLPILAGLAGFQGILLLRHINNMWAG